MIEIKNKKTGLVTVLPIAEFLDDEALKLGTKGKLNMLIDLADGKIWQNLDVMCRLRGLVEYKWNWAGFPSRGKGGSDAP